MLSEHEMQFHRSFLGLKMALAIWNEDYTHQNTRGGPPDRQRRRESDPVYAYHVHQGPHYPSKPPGDRPDKKYNAILARGDGGFEPLVITTKRGLSGQNFASAATPWELTNSVLCGGGQFNPVVNAMMEVTGHYANVNGQQLIHPKGINFSDPSEYLTNEVPVYLWHKVQVRKNTAWAGSNGRVDYLPAPEGWESFAREFSSIDVMVLLNGEVIGAKGNRFSSNNGRAVSVLSPLDFWAPGSRLLASAIRGLTNRMSAAVVRGFKVLTAPSKEMAELTVTRMAGKTLTRMAVSTRGVGVLPVKHLGRRTIIADADAAELNALFAKSKSVDGMYDVLIHGEANSFGIWSMGADGKLVWREVGVREVADAIRPHLAKGDQIRLIACHAGKLDGGPAQQLANTLNRTVWAPDATVYPVLGRPIVNNGKVIGFDPAKSFVPEGGKFFDFHPTQRGSATLAGKDGTETGNVLFGEIRTGGKK